MRALSLCQPWAERIANGSKHAEYRTWRAPSAVGHDLLIVASKRLREVDKTKYAGEPRGVAVCVVRVDAMRGKAGRWSWVVSNPRRVKPIPVIGRAALFYVADKSIVFVRSARASAKRR